jgi:hypothetical protein
MNSLTGLLRLDVGAPLPVSAARAKGYDSGLVAILDKPETVTVYAEHPAHLEYVLMNVGDVCYRKSRLTMTGRVHKYREELCDDTLAYDLEFKQ